jgi:hypothetical protein
LHGAAVKAAAPLQDAGKAHAPGVGFAGISCNETHEALKDTS